MNVLPLDVALGGNGFCIVFLVLGIKTTSFWHFAHLETKSILDLPSHVATFLLHTGQYIPKGLSILLTSLFAQKEALPTWQRFSHLGEFQCRKEVYNFSSIKLSHFSVTRVTSYSKSLEYIFFTPFSVFPPPIFSATSLQDKPSTTLSSTIRLV